MSCIGLYFVPSSLACHVYFMLYFFVFHFSIIFSFILHLSCIIFYPCSYFFLSFLPLDSFVYSWQEGGEYSREHIGVYYHFYMTYMHILKGRDSTSCTFIGGESYRGDAYTKGEKTFIFFFRKPCFVLFYFMLGFFFCFMVLWVTFSIHALLLLSHRVYVLDMHTSLCYCALLDACSDDHLLCYIIIVVISICLFCVWSSCSYVLQHVYLIVCLLVTLYLSFYCLIYLEGLMCFVNVFQVIGIYVPSSS